MNTPKLQQLRNVYHVKIAKSAKKHHILALRFPWARFKPRDARD